MSTDTNKNWVYQVVGRNVELWEVVIGGSIDSLGGGEGETPAYKIRMPGVASSKKLVYPSEAIDGGLMFEGTAFIEPFVDLDPNELAEDENGNLSNPELTEETYALETLDEESHINLNRTFSLAIIDYLKAMFADKSGDLQKKEYYMREFWKKAGDAQSNKFGVPIMAPSGVYSVR
jgi:hypothetical protein